MLMTVHWMCKHFFYWFLQLKEGKGGSFLSLRLHRLEIWTANYTSVTLAKCPLSWKKNRANHKTHFHFFSNFLNLRISHCIQSGMNSNEKNQKQTKKNFSHFEPIWIFFLLPLLPFFAEYSQSTISILTKTVFALQLFKFIFHCISINYILTYWNWKFNLKHVFV